MEHGQKVPEGPQTAASEIRPKKALTPTANVTAPAESHTDGIGDEPASQTAVILPTSNKRRNHSRHRRQRIAPPEGQPKKTKYNPTKEASEIQEMTSRLTKITVEKPSRKYIPNRNMSHQEFHNVSKHSEKAHKCSTKSPRWTPQRSEVYEYEYESI